MEDTTREPAFGEPTPGEPATARRLWLPVVLALAAGLAIGTLVGALVWGDDDDLAGDAITTESTTTTTTDEERSELRRVCDDAMDRALEAAEIAEQGADAVGALDAREVEAAFESLQESVDPLRSAVDECREELLD